MKFFLPIIWLPIVVFCSGTLKEDYYITLDLPDGTHCYTILNGTHQFGCKSTSGHSRGVVVKIDSLKQLDEIDSCWRSRFEGYNGGYFLYMDIALVGRVAVEKILKSDCVRGLLLHEGVQFTLASKDALSADSSCPNNAGDFYKECKPWNERGSIMKSGLLTMAWNIQIIFINGEKENANMMKCYDMFNVPQKGSSSINYPFCAVSIEHSQHAAGNSEICRRRSKSGSKFLDVRMEGVMKFCDQIRGMNVIGYFPPAIQKKGERKTPKKYLLLASRMDSFGVIPNISPGDFSIMTSLVTLLATAKAIGTHAEAFEEAAKTTNKHVLMTFFAGEAFDYVGSSHMMYLTSQGKFPDFGDSTSFPNSYPKISPKEIEGIVEPQQIGLSDTLHAHVDKNDEKKPLVEDLIKWLDEGAASEKATVDKIAGRIPPSSWHSLKKINGDGVGVVLAPYGKEHYDYGRINSMMDRNDWNTSDRDEVERRIQEAASALLRVAGEYVGVGPAVTNMTVDIDFVAELFECLVVSKNYNCTVLRKMGTVPIKEREVKSTYTSVEPRLGIISNTIFELLAFASGTTAHTKNVKDKSQCEQVGQQQQIYSYEWMGDYMTGKSYCYRFAVNTSIAQSPAFLIEDYDFTNNTYSTWTESVYSQATLNMFLLENKLFDWMMVVGGVVLVLLSFLIVFRCEEKTFVVDEGERAAAIGEPL